MGRPSPAAPIAPAARSGWPPVPHRPAPPPIDRGSDHVRWPYRRRHPVRHDHDPSVD